MAKEKKSYSFKEVEEICKKIKEDEINKTKAVLWEREQVIKSLKRQIDCYETLISIIKGSDF